MKYRVKYKYTIEGRRVDWDIKFFDDLASANGFVEWMKSENKLIGFEKYEKIEIKEWEG